MSAFPAGSVEPGSGSFPKNLAQKALQANIAHQRTLTKYARQIEAELQELDNLISAVDTSDDGDGGFAPGIIIPGAKKPAGPCPPAEFWDLKSPFFGEASQRTSFLNNTTMHSMKANELEVLAEAVRNENLRLQAYELYRKGQGLAAGTRIDLENNTEGLDWVVIAEKVSSVSSVKRTADQCRIKWLGDRHPRFNHGEWSPAELNKLRDIIDSRRAGASNIDWFRVANELGTNRTPIDCMRHGIPRQRHTWNQTSDKKLLDAVKRHGNNNWSVVARFVSEDVTAPQCQSRYSRLDPALKRGKWSKEEDSQLELAFKAYGNSWVEVAACIPGRTNGQCREHWSELSSSRSQWTEEEEKSLIDAVSTMGNSWTKIAEQLGHGRTGQQCRLRYDRLKKLQALQLSIDAGPSVPKGDATGVEGSSPGGKRGRISNISEISVPCRTSQPAPAPKARPRPRPLGKGKARETDLPTAEPGIPDEPISINDDTAITNISTKRKSTMNHPVDETPAPKKRKSVKAKGDATVADPNSETVAPIRHRSSMPMSVGARSSPRNNTGGPAASTSNHGDSDLGSSVHNRNDHGEGESETGTSSMAAGLPPKPRGLKVASCQPLKSTDPQPSTDINPSGNMPIPRAARRTKRVAGLAKKRTPNMSSLKSRSTDTAEVEMAPVEGLNSTATFPQARRRRVRSTISSDVPRRQSARVSARNLLPSTIINGDAIGADSSFSPEPTQNELPSNASSPLTELDSA